MAVKALQFIHAVARKLLAKPTKPSEGLTTIANRMQAEAKASEIAETFRAAGLPLENLDTFIKSEKDVTKYLNIIESTQKQAIEQATEKSKDILKLPKKKEEPFTGFKPKVVERSMSVDDYADFKEEWFVKILANTDEALNTFLKRGINASDERFVTLSKNQRKDFLDMVEYRLKHGNEKFMNDSEMFFKKNGRTLNAYGGLAGMLGERTGYFRGALADTKAGKSMSPGTRADYRQGQGHRENVGRPPGGGDPGMTYTPKPRLTREEYIDSLLPPGPSDRHPGTGKMSVFPKSPFKSPFRDMFIPEFQKRRYLYQDEDDLPEGILELLKKDPNFDLETFLNIGWSMPENVWDKGAQGLRGIYYNTLPEGIKVPIPSTGEPPGERTRHGLSGGPDAEWIPGEKEWNPEDIEGHTRTTYRTPSGGPTERIWDPEKLGDPTSRTFTEKFFNPVYRGIDLQMRPFKKDDTPWIANPNEPTSYADESRMSNVDKARVALHEMRHKKYIENPVLWKSQPQWVQDVEMPGTSENIQFRENRVREPVGHELYTRFLDQRYFPPMRDPGGEPYFDKILKDLWEPSAKEYEKIIKEYELSPVNLAGGGLAPLLGEPTYADGGRTGFAGGKLAFDAARRKFLQWLGVGAAGTAAAKSGLLSIFKGGGTKAVIKDLTSVPIKNISGMPPWFKPLVNQVIKKGDDVTKNYATLDRQIVHKSTLPDSKTDVIVTQDLNTGDVAVDIGMGKHGWADGHFGQPVRLEYKASEVIEPNMGRNYQIKDASKPTKGPLKTKEEFWVEEAEFTGGHPENVKFEESSFNKFGQHGSNFDEVEKFATGKVKKVKTKSKPRPMDQKDIDYASGGRVPMWLGGSLGAGKEFIRQLVKKLAKDRGITGSYLMKVMNPKAFKKFINDPANVHKWDPKTGIFATEKAKQLMKSTKTARVDQLERYLDMAKTSKEGDKNIQSLIAAAMKSGMSRESAEKLAKGLREAIDVEDIIPRNVTDETILELEQMLKNLRTKDRKLNATGGRVPLAGGKKPGRKGNPLDWMELLNPDEDPDDLEEIIKYLKQSIREGLGRYNQGGRVPLFWGGTAGKKLWQKFIEKQFLKASNDIRQGKGLFKGLTQEQWIKKHDDLTKKLKEWEMGGKKSLPKDMKEYFGMNEMQLANKFKKAQTQVAGSADELSGIKKVKMTGDENLDYDWVETPEGWVKKPGSEGAFFRFGEKNKELIDKGVKNLRQETILREFDIKGKKPHATGGRVSLSAGGLAGMLGE